MTGLTEEARRAYETAGDIVRRIKRGLAGRTRDRTRLLDLALYVENETVRLGGRPAFPCNISVNEIASHCTPRAGDGRLIGRADIVKFDLGVIIGGYIADSAFTVEVGTACNADMIAATEQALSDAIAAVRPGVSAGEIGRVIETSARKNNFNVLKGLYGHNLERDCLHGSLTIPNYDDGSRKKVREGDVIAIEPFLTKGDGEIVRQSGGGIYQLIRRSHYFQGEDREKILLSRIERNYNGFPFARRWLPDPEALDRLAERSIVMEYPMLVEKDGAPVAQAEHTAIVERDGCRVIT